MKLNKYIDHTLLRPTAQISELEKLCEEAIKYDLYSVCINGSHISICFDKLKDSSVRVCSVVGFPLGAMSTTSKIFEAANAIENGADEIDMVINLGWFKDKNYQNVLKEISGIKNAIDEKVLKVIIETCFLSDPEKKDAASIVLDSGADFVKTSTGFGGGGASFGDIELISSVIKDKIKIKASGGIRDYQTAKKYIEMGVSRLGTSNGVSIVEGHTGILNY